MRSSTSRTNGQSECWVSTGERDEESKKLPKSGNDVSSQVKNGVVGRRCFCFPSRSPEHRTQGEWHPFPSRSPEHRGKKGDPPPLWMKRVRWCRHGSDLHPKMVRRWMTCENRTAACESPSPLGFCISGLTAITRRVGGQKGMMMSAHEHM